MLQVTTIALALAVMWPTPPGPPVAGAQDDYGSRSSIFVRSRVPQESPSPASGRAKPKAARAPARPAAPLGLGFTVFRKSETGKPVRVDPRRPLATHDFVRFVFESNEPGFLYVFNTDAKGNNLAMIYPNARLRKGENRVEAHALYEVPSGSESPDDRWLELLIGEGQKPPVTERMVVVLARQPLPGVPCGPELMKLAGDDGSYVWVPDPETWRGLGVQANTTAASEASYGAPITADEDSAGSRIVRLPPAGPKPSSVCLTSAASVVRLVTVVDLVHVPTQ